jgi:hypothetical protein
MIQLRSILDVADNTGARKAALIQRMGQPTPYAHVGDIVTVHIKESTTDATVKKGEVAKAVVVRTKAPIRRHHRHDQQSQGHPHLRTRRPRTAREELHEDHLARAGGPLTRARSGS